MSESQNTVAITPATGAEIICSACPDHIGKTVFKTNGDAKLPRNWKYYNGRPVCGKCRKELRRIRTLRWKVNRCVRADNIPDNAVKVIYPGKRPGKQIIRFFPIEKTTPQDPAKLSDWAAAKLQEIKKLKEKPTNVQATFSFDVMQFLEPLFADVFQAMTMVTQRLFQQEKLPVRNGKFEVKIDKSVTTPLAHELSAAFPWMQHVRDSILIAARKKYIHDRFQILVKGESHLLTYTYGHPIPIRATMWFPYPVGPDRKYPQILIKFSKDPADKDATHVQAILLELAGGRKYKEYMQRFASLFSTDESVQAIKCAMSLRAKAKANRPRWQAELYANLTLEVPKQHTEDVEKRYGTFYISTDDDAFLVGIVHKHKITRFSGSKIRRAIKRHEKRLFELADSQKYERRVNQRDAAYIGRIRQRAVEAAHAEIKNEIEQRTTELVNYADRKKFAVVAFDGKARRWSKDFNFPWYSVKLRVQQKTEAIVGMKFESVDAQETT